MPTYLPHPGHDHHHVVTKLVPQPGAGQAPHAPGEGAFDHFAHAESTVRHLAQAGGLNDPSPTSLRHWPVLTEATPENEAELASRIRKLIDAGAYKGDERVHYAKRWLAEYEAEQAAPGPEAA